MNLHYILDLFFPGGITISDDSEPASPSQNFSHEEMFPNQLSPNIDENDGLSDIEEVPENYPAPDIIEIPTIDPFEFNGALMDYLARLGYRESFAKTLKKLNLTPEEETKFEKFHEPIYLELPKTPVVLFEQLHDLRNLQRLIKENLIGKDIYRRKFTLRDIQPAFTILKEFDKKVEEVKANRKRVEEERLAKIAAEKARIQEEKLAKKNEDKITGGKRKLECLSTHPTTLFADKRLKVTAIEQNISENIKQLLPRR